MQEIKVLIIGLDGATWDLIKPWAEEGKLSTFKKLTENGTWGFLESTIPYITLPAWISMITGKNPGKIGYVHFFMRDKESYNFRFVKPKVESLNPIWKLLKLKGNRTSFILKIPTIPRDAYMEVYLKGEFVFDDVVFTGREKELLKKIRRDNSPPVKHNKEYILWHADQIEKELDLIKYILKNSQKYSWDFIISVIYSIDHLSHLFWKFIDKNHPNYTQNKDIQEAIMKYYSILDSKLDEICEICREKGIILFVTSDHGHGPLRKRVNLNKWLIENGYMRLLRPVTKEQNARVLLQKLAIKMRNWRIPYRLYQILPERIKEHLRKKLHLQLDIETKNIDWEHTKAYFSGYNGININLKRRESRGIISGKEYDDLVFEISEKLRAVKDPEIGKPIVKNIWEKYELYTGDFVENLPDIIIEYSGESEYESVLGFNEQYLVDKPLFYNSEVSSAHKRNGIFLVYGPGIKRDQKVDAKIYDIAPTILHIFGLAIPNDMDGRVLMEIFEEDSEFAKRKPKYVDPSYYEKKQEIEEKIGREKEEEEYSEEEERLIKERLRALGYLE